MVRHLRRCVFTLLTTFIAAHAVAFEWQVDITPVDQLFPALQLSQASRSGASTRFGGGDGLVSVHVRGGDIPADLRVRIETPGLRAPATVMPGAGSVPGSLDLRPLLDWDVDDLAHLRAPRRQTMTVTLEAPGRLPESRRVAVRVHPLDDALYFVREGQDRVDLGWAFAGYVNPADPVVDEVLAAARAFDPAFDAAPSGRGDDVDRRRVGAVWAALERRGLRYANGDPALSRGPSVWSQRVRLLRSIWDDRQANCLDSSVLIASVLERLGLRTFIVLVPGHAFVGFQSRSVGDAAHYLETTLLGARPSTTAPLANYDSALRAGRARWRRVAAKFDGRHGPAYARVDIVTARSYGIIPFSAARSRSQ
ncbi:MAG: hypothetical protein ABIR62_06365 [Dokdonella sp.]|uniref:hypothetical protein n=1 Tax=Dokdonella sp. TaxID=2291710 RepID=UPI003265511F